MKESAPKNDLGGAAILMDVDEPVEEEIKTASPIVNAVDEEPETRSKSITRERKRRPSKSDSTSPKAPIKRSKVSERTRHLEDAESSDSDDMQVRRPLVRKRVVEDEGEEEAEDSMCLIEPIH